MARDDWVSVYLPKEMYDKLKMATEDPTFRSKGFTTPKELVVQLIRTWLEHNEIGEPDKDIIA